MTNDVIWYADVSMSLPEFVKQTRGDLKTKISAMPFSLTSFLFYVIIVFN